MSCNSSNISKEKKTVILDLFKTMKESPASTSYSNLAKNWLEECGCFTGFVDGKWLPPTTSISETKLELAEGLPVTVKWASSDELTTIVENSREGFKSWQEYTEKSNVLYRISQCIEDNRKLLNAIESLTINGRYREKYNANYLSDSFRYHAGLVSDKEFSKEWKPTGVVCIVSCDDNNLDSSLWMLSALLASGNAVICLVDFKEYLSAFLLAQLCLSVGLPAGVFNVVPCKLSLLSDSLDVDKIILSSSKLQSFQSGILNKNIPCETFSHLLSCSIIYESADLDAAISNILERVNIFDTEDRWPVSVIYLQESIQKQFIKLLVLKVCGSVGNCAKSRPPFCFLGSEITISQIIDQLSACSSEDNTKDLFNVQKSTIGQNPPISCATMSFNSNSDQDKSLKYAPGIQIEQFRTVKESIAMFNHDKKNSKVSIWSEETYLSLEVSSKLKSRTVWINCQDIYEPSVPYGSLYLTGNSNIGGKEAVYSHLLCLKEDKDCVKSFDKEVQLYGSQAPNSSIISIKNNEGKKIEKCVTLYIGGACVNSNGETFQKVFDANNEPYSYVASANKSDIDKAVSSASSSQTKWEVILKIKCAAIFRKASEILSKRKEEFVLDLSTVTGQTKEVCSKEVESVVSVLLYWASYISHFDGRIVETKFHGKVLLEYQPLGVIGIQCPDKEPLLSFVYLIAPSIIFGNAVVAISSEKYPTCAFKMCEVFQAAGLPGGVLNVVSSSRAFLTRHLSSHRTVDALWFSEDGADFIYDSYYSIQPKRIFNCKNMVKKLEKINTEKFVLESTYSKAVFIPMGTGFV